MTDETAAVAAPSAAQEQARPEAGGPRDLDLVFTVVSLDRTVAMNGSEDEVEVALTADVLFALIGHLCARRPASRIRETADRIGEAKPARVRVAGGYTDSKGSAVYNQRLSARRAAASRIRSLRTRRKTAATTLAAALAIVV